MSVHKILPSGARVYRCFGVACKTPEKNWARKDNFMSHLKKFHQSDGQEELLARSQAWWNSQQEGWFRVDNEDQFVASTQVLQKPATPRYRNPPSDSGYAGGSKIIPIYPPIIQPHIPRDMRMGFGNPIPVTPQYFEHQQRGLKMFTTTMVNDNHGYMPLLSQSHIGRKHDTDHKTPTTLILTSEQDDPKVSPQRSPETTIQLGGRVHRVHRVQNACDICRFYTVKCSGDQPVCRRCQDWGVQCSYKNSDKDQKNRSVDSLNATFLQSSIADTTGSQHEVKRITSDTWLQYAQWPTKRTPPEKWRCHFCEREQYVALVPNCHHCGHERCRGCRKLYSNEHHRPTLSPGSKKVTHFVPSITDTDEAQKTDVSTITGSMQPVAGQVTTLRVSDPPIDRPSGPFSQSIPTMKFGSEAVVVSPVGADHRIEGLRPGIETFKVGSVDSINGSVSSLDQSDSEGSFLGEHGGPELYTADERRQLDAVSKHLASLVLQKFVRQNIRQTVSVSSSPDHDSGSQSGATGVSSSSSLPSGASSKKRSFNSPTGPGNNDNVNEDGNSKRNCTNSSVQSSARLLACQYYRFDAHRYSASNAEEVCYRSCSSVVLRDISRLKQHLYRVHRRPDFYCGRCNLIFGTETDLDIHARQEPACTTQPPLFQEKMSRTQENKIKRRNMGADARTAWFKIFKILFPDAETPPPAHAYADGEHLSVVHEFVQYFETEAPTILSSLLRGYLHDRGFVNEQVNNILNQASEHATSRLVLLMWQRLNGRQGHQEPNTERLNEGSGHAAAMNGAPDTVPELPALDFDVLQEELHFNLDPTEWFDPNYMDGATDEDSQ